MKKFSWILLFIAIAVHLSGQNFFRENFDHDKKYILLANPTIGNLKTVNFFETKISHRFWKKTRTILSPVFAWACKP
jgi:hypothetical protein